MTSEADRSRLDAIYRRNGVVVTRSPNPPTSRPRRPRRPANPLHVSDGSAKALCEFAGCTYRQFDYWSRLGVFGPTAANPGGSGTRRNGFTRTDFLVARALARITQAGLSCAQNMTTDVLAAKLRAQIDPDRANTGDFVVSVTSGEYVSVTVGLW